MPTTAHAQATVRAVLESVERGRITLRIPNTDYRLSLILDAPESSITVPPGKRIKGVIHAQSLRVHREHAGGRFIEPVWGEPRIVAGRILALDPDRNRLLIDVAVPMWVTPAEGQSADAFHVGEMVNFYVESGARFVPAPDGADGGGHPVETPHVAATDPVSEPQKADA